MNKLQNIKISYCETNSRSAVYRQQISMTQNQYNLIVKKIKSQLLEGVEYGNYLMLPEQDFKDVDLFFMNLSTARFVKSMVKENQQKRFKMDVNSFISIRKK